MFFYTGLFLFFYFFGSSQNRAGDFSILFYNVENLFDTKDDSIKNDHDYLPGGIRGWNRERFNDKINKISKVILSSAGWDPPPLIGLCEVENNYVLQRLVKNTALLSYGYKFIHKESPDERGIDVAVLYDPAKFYPLFYRFYPVKSENGEILKSREILHVCGLTNPGDTIHFFVNHWPSRYSGLMNTQKLRFSAATALAEKTTQLLVKNSKSKIIIVGDFNDQPNDKSILEVLNANPVGMGIENTSLYNLSFAWMNDEIQTLKYQSQWNVFDQIIVSGYLLNTSEGVRCHAADGKIVQLPFLLEPDENYGGVKPFRTFVGATYQKGFSDHLPVLLPLKSD